MSKLDEIRNDLLREHLPGGLNGVLINLIDEMKRIEGNPNANFITVPTSPFGCGCWDNRGGWDGTNGTLVRWFRNAKKYNGNATVECPADAKFCEVCGKQRGGKHE